MKILGMEVSEDFGQVLATAGVILGVLFLIRLLFKYDVYAKIGEKFSSVKTA